MTAHSTAVTEPDVLDKVARAVGADRIALAPSGGTGSSAHTTLGPNTSLFRSRDVRGLVRPRTAEEVRRIVEIFGRSADSGRPYPPQDIQSDRVMLRIVPQRQRVWGL